MEKAALAGIDWMPIDELAEALIESAMWVRKHERDDTRGDGGEPRVLNMRNPRQTSWAALIPSVKAAFEARGELVSVVEYDKWLEALKTSASATLEPGVSGMEHRARANPAIGLLDFFEKIGNEGIETPLETGKALTVSLRLEKMSRVDGTMMRRWVEGWINDNNSS